jgi:hypothetical protein
MADLGRRSLIMLGVGGALAGADGLFKQVSAEPALRVNTAQLATQLLSTPPQNWNAQQLLSIEGAAHGSLERVSAAVPQAAARLTSQIEAGINRAAIQENNLANQMDRAGAQLAGAKSGSIAQIRDQNHIDQLKETQQKLVDRHDADPLIGRYMQEVHAGKTDPNGAMVQASQDVAESAAVTRAAIQDLLHPPVAAPSAPAPANPQAQQPSVINL